MSGIIDSLYIIKYNPFKFGEHLASFYSSLNEVENNLLLAPLVIPLCGHPAFKDKLGNAVFGKNRKSTMFSVFDDRAKLHDLQERLYGFKRITEQSIQFCLVNDWLTLDIENLMLRQENKTDTNTHHQKHSINLAKLFSNHSLTEIYSFFGVKP
ncbi:DUF6521 family protein [Pectobacterium aroidearum]|uniref:three component ABC system middle component n=1 Tax=Pectobacterium aroidearum TaxID=1201031 RepID=UPI0033076C65